MKFYIYINSYMEELTKNSDKYFSQLTEIESLLRKMNNIPKKYNNFIYKTDLQLDWPELNNCFVFGNPKTNFYFYLTNSELDICEINNYFIKNDSHIFLRYRGNDILKIFINLPDELCFMKHKNITYRLHRSNTDKEFICPDFKEYYSEEIYTKPEVFRLFWQNEVNFDISNYIHLIQDLKIIENNVENIKRIDYSKCYGFIGDKISKLYSVFNLTQYKPIPYIDNYNES